MMQILRQESAKWVNETTRGHTQRLHFHGTEENIPNDKLALLTDFYLEHTALELLTSKISIFMLDFVNEHGAAWAKSKAAELVTAGELPYSISPNRYEAGKEQGAQRHRDVLTQFLLFSFILQEDPNEGLLIFEDVNLSENTFSIWDAIVFTPNSFHEAPHFFRSTDCIKWIF
eukprot:IDg6431t1